MIKRAVMFVCIFLFLILRRPDAFTTPQFYAEDGNQWYAAAYNRGPIPSLFLSSAGYLQTFSRLTASASLLVPLSYAPLFFNIVALLVLVLPIFYLISSRFHEYPFKARLSLCLAYLFLTNTSETFLNVTNAQWYLALVMYLILIAPTATTRMWKVLDTACMIVAGLSGPFSLLLLLPAGFLVKKKQLSLNSPRIILLGIGATFQLISLALNSISGGGRLFHLVQMEWMTVYQILYRQILWGALAGPTGYQTLTTLPFHELFFAISTLLFLWVGIYLLRKANPSYVGFILFAVIIFVVSLLSPTVARDGERSILMVMLHADGIRYWLIPMIGVFLVFFWGVRESNPKYIRGISLFFLSTLLFFNIKHLARPLTLRYPAYKDLHWQAEVEKFDNLEPRTQQMILINPPGWQMTLKKK
jgi:hypothetical protein